MTKTYKRGEDVKLSTNFHLKEFECHCNYADCTEVPVNEDHIARLQTLRNTLGKSIKITSGYRCPKHNKDVGGVAKSQHVLGNATDIQVTGIGVVL